jgi:heptaprenyl diphosphate synthase
MKTKKIALLSMCVALAMILSYVESLLPSPGVPGVKLGLANLVVIFALYRLGPREAAGISLLRVFLVSLLFGHAASLLYSAAGAILSLAGMILLKKTDRLSCVAVSVIGGVLHNVGQILTAWLLMGPNVVYYLPVLILSGTAAGVAIGAVSALLIRRIKIN